MDPVQPANNASEQRPVFPKAVSLVLGILTVIGGIYLFMLLKDAAGFKSRVMDPAQNEQTTTQNQWNKPTSTHQGVPVIERENGTVKGFAIYNLTTKQLKKIDTKIMASGGALGAGNTDPLPSPDLLYTAVIDENKNLWVIANETLEATAIAKTGTVTYVTAWSPNSDKLIYYIPRDTVASRREGPVVWDQKEVFSHGDNSAGGFYLFDLITGKTTYLSPVEYVETFIDNDRILVRTDAQSDRLIVFNLNTFEADFTKVKEFFGFGAGQFNVAQDGTKWTYTLSRFPTSDSNIIYAPFPNREGEQVDNGFWSVVQWPLLSPNGKKLAYSRQENFINGLATYNIWVYDVDTKSKTRYSVEGFSYKWVNDTSLVVKASDASKATEYLYLLDIKSSNATKLY